MDASWKENSFSHRVFQSLKQDFKHEVIEEAINIGTLGAEKSMVPKKIWYTSFDSE